MSVPPAREYEPDPETLRLVFEMFLDPIPADQRAHMTVRLLSEVEYLHYAAGVRCPRWITRTRAEFAAFGELPPARETDGDGS
jgi:hypothetical protein